MTGRIYARIISAVVLFSAFPLFSLWAQVAQELPKFDVADFVITGNETIDLPVAEKIESGEQPQPLAFYTEGGTGGRRDRETAELAQRIRERFSNGGVPPAFLRADASMATYLSPNLGVWYGQDDGNSRFLVHTEYAQTDGYEYNSKWSGGGIDASGATPLIAPGTLFHGAVLKGSLGYRAASYGLFGSASPSLRRNFSRFEIAGEFQRALLKALPFSFGIVIGTTGIRDSAKSASETRLSLSGSTRIMQFKIPWNLEGNLYSSFMSGSGDGVRLLRLAVTSEPVPFEQVIVSGGLGFVWGRGMKGQTTVRLLPALTVGVQIHPRHIVEGRFAPRVESRSFAGFLEINPYLATAVDIRNTVLANTGGVFVLSDWDGRLRTRTGFEVCTIDDLPMFVDTANTGLWQIAYSGRTTIAMFSAEAFATLSVNDYFSASVKFTSSRNAGTGEQVPYLPSMEAVARYDHRFLESLRSFAALKYMHRRASGLNGTADMPGVVLADIGAEYRIDQILSLSVIIQNLTDQRYALWRGYRELPFTIALGISARW